METCAAPGCDQPGTNKCSGCKTTLYCGPTCQKAHWALHKESCDGRLRKMGMAHLVKAKEFHEEHNWPQALRYSDLAITKLKQLKDRLVQNISEALDYKCTALGFLGQYRQQLECAKEWYCLWNTKPTDPGAIDAAFALIHSCITNKEYADAHLYASTLWEIINHKHDNKIPEDQRQQYIAEGAYCFADATLALARTGGIPPEEKQKAGQEAIMLLRRALELHTHLLGAESGRAANDMAVLADALACFTDCDNDEIIRLFEQAKAIQLRVYGNSSVNVAATELNSAATYLTRATRARTANELDREQANLELALPHCHESARIYRAVGHADMVERTATVIAETEEKLRWVADARAAAEAAATRG